MVSLEEVFCPKCKVGFAPDTGKCPFCNVRLVPKDALENEPEVESGEESEDDREIPEPVILNDDISLLEKLRTADVYWISYLQGRLAEVGIPHRMEPSYPLKTSFSVYVRPEDLPRAKEIDEKVFTEEVPESEGMPHVEDLDFWTCPACGSRLGEKDLVCGSCGLVLSPPEARRCSHCHKEVDTDALLCPFCGHDLNRSKI